MAASRSRRGPSKRQLARDAEFDSLRKVLRSDELRSEQCKLEDEGDVYEVVDESRYHEIVKQRRTGRSAMVEPSRLLEETPKPGPALLSA